LAGTDIHSSRHRFSFPLWQARATQPTSQGRLDPRLPWQPHDTHLYKNNLPLIDICLSFRSDKTLTFSDGAIKNNRYLPVSFRIRCFRFKRRKLLFVRIQRHGCFPAAVLHLSSCPLFASVSHGGVHAGLLFFFFRYHTFGVWGCSLFLIITEAATYPSSR
jgi:hypothetical protein